MNIRMGSYTNEQLAQIAKSQAEASTRAAAAANAAGREAEATAASVRDMASERAAAYAAGVYSVGAPVAQKSNLPLILTLSGAALAGYLYWKAG